MGSGRLSRISAVAANTFREARRERVFYNLLVFALLMTLCGLLLAKLSIRQHEKIIKDVGLACMDVFGTLIALFMGVGLVRKEIERRSLLALLAKPLRRDELFLGKFAGLAMTLLVNVGVMTAGLYLTLWASGARADARLLAAAYPIYLSLLLVVALAQLFSTLASSTTTATVVTFCLVAAGRFSDVIRQARTVAPQVPNWLVQAVYSVIPNFRNFDFKDQVAYGDPVPLAALAWVTLYAVVYLALVLGLGMAAFRSTELR
jgi:ABC-type transport system involved in multi-copper enzyme maturation permease subunit